MNAWWVIRRSQPVADEGVVASAPVLRSSPATEDGDVAEAWSRAYCAEVAVGYVGCMPRALPVGLHAAKIGKLRTWIGQQLERLP